MQGHRLVRAIGQQHGHAIRKTGLLTANGRGEEAGEDHHADAIVQQGFAVDARLELRGNPTFASRPTQVRLVPCADAAGLRQWGVLADQFADTDQAFGEAADAEVGKLFGVPCD